MVVDIKGIVPYGTFSNKKQNFNTRRHFNASKQN